MTEISFDISWEQCASGDPLESATFGSLAIHLAGIPITEVRDDAARTTRQVVRVSAYPLALWLASSWWRLRWEGRRPTLDWQMSHQLASTGGGYVWPEVTFESDGEFIHVAACRRTSAEWEPVTYLNSAKGAVAREQFEYSIRSFIETVLTRLREMGHPDSPLAELWTTERAETTDEAVDAERRLEAVLGFDAEEAPPALLTAYAEGAERFGASAVTELAAVATNGTPPDWDDIATDLGIGAPIRVDRFEQSKGLAERAVTELRAGAEPWERGEAAARAVRGGLGLPRGALSNDTLRGWLGADLSESDQPSSVTAMGHRADPRSPDLLVRYRSTHGDGRRFELARLLGDHLIAASPTDRLLPATRTGTARQRVQRAFAAELLLPWEDLAARVGDSPDTESIESTAREFGVSPLVVRTRLVAKHVLPADALDL